MHPIDAFLGAKRSAQSLTTQPQAPRSILLRRLYLDLVGLPPTSEQLRDTRPWEEIVDELLASPQHGERWARHWMDVWRYSDWYGLGNQLRNSQKHLWHWRDWIVESLNADKGYDRMIVEMLAADEVSPTDRDALRATGFLARNYYLFNRTTWLDSTIEHTGKAFMGLTLNCAKCHDHKYDPITQLDYYRFRAIFEPHQVRLDPVPGVTDLEKDGLPRVFDDHLDAKTFLHVRGDPKNPDRDTEIQPGVPAILASFAPEIREVELPVAAYAPSMRDYVRRDHQNKAQAEVDAAQAEHVAAFGKLKALPEDDPAPKTAKSPTKPANGKPSKFEITDDFAGPNPKLWELTGEGWEYRDGALHQTVATRDAASLALRLPHPRNFELVCRYTTTGGATYKSVTFRFDQGADAKSSNFVYTSAHAPGPKVQIAFTRKGQHTYPPDGRVAKPIKVGETYDLRFAVRERLVNVWLNDEFILAYQLPERATTTNPRIALSGFDATVAFDSITVRSLPVSVKLTSAGNSAPESTKSPRKSAELAVAIAQAKLAAAQARLDALKAALDADNEKLKPNNNEQAAKQLAALAAERQAKASVATAEYEVQAAAAEKRKAAEKRLADAKKKLAALDPGKSAYRSVRASRKALETPAHKEADYPAVYASSSTGRRRALAEWLTSRENPLTARVAVNHVWMRHFGQPLVESVFDLGLRSARPQQAELLDFLSAEFMDNGWSFRHLHRLIVTSQAYRLSSSAAKADSETLKRDPNNQFYWRMHPRRMEAQVVRDSLMHLAGTLNLQLGGPSVDPGKGSRRSLYFKHSRDAQDKFLSMFDDADHLQCYRRGDSIVPQQALALSNSSLSIQAAEKIAVRLTASGLQEQPAFVDGAFELLLGRLPVDEERRQCDLFWSQLGELLKNENPSNRATRIRTRFVHSLLNHNDFISIR